MFKGFLTLTHFDYKKGSLGYSKKLNLMYNDRCVNVWNPFKAYLHVMQRFYI